MATSQHRCVFVGNIPYDATEEQLMEICREVGPVVSFRLVIDRETGKPKGYGFCEYKDEETALSARRNLQGYEINGRQLRVDFAENDKGTDKTREQGRGGPGLAPNPGGPTLGESVNNQPIGLHSAITAATIMSGALGGPQVAPQPTNQTGLQSQPASVNDPLSLHLAKMSRNQLNGIFSEIKGMATHNKDQARQLLLARPQLLKALFQVEIMLGIVPPQMLQMPNIRQASTQATPAQQAVVQDPRLPPNAQSGLGHNQPPQIQRVLGQDGIPSIMHPSVRSTQTQLASSSSLYANKPPIVRPTTDSKFQPGPSTSSGIPDAFNRDARDDATWTHKTNAYSNMPFSLPEKKPMIPDPLEVNNRPSKILKVGHLNNAPGSSSQAFGVNSMAAKTFSKAEEMQYPEKQIAQPQLPRDVESALLQQVMKLTPEQLNSLPPDQRQQVIQLQQALLQKPS